MAARRILALVVVRGTNVYQAWDAVKDIKKNRRGCNAQQTIVENYAIVLFKLRTALLQRDNKNSNKSFAAANSK